jgi:hypothetical protein
MKTLTSFGLLLTAALAITGPAVAEPPKNKPAGRLVVHEWGTFLSVQGSDGVTLGGMVDSDEVLPPFVETRGIQSWLRCGMTQKMETPVTYFYADRPMEVAVRVEMPKGVLTHWFPAVREYGPGPGDWFPAAREHGPGPSDNDISAALAKGNFRSFLDWPRVHVIPAALSSTKGMQAPAAWLPRIASDQIWKFARETDSAILKLRTVSDAGGRLDQYEKFLFYRGVGAFSLPLEIRCSASSTDGKLSLSLHNHGSHLLCGLVAVCVDDNSIWFATLGNLESNVIRSVPAEELWTSPEPLEVGVPHVKSVVAQELVAAGLYPKEAQAMVNTWEKSYFRTAGLRVLYVLPRQTVDQIIPIQVKPTPNQLERVMVGRVEVLTPDREKQIEEFVADLGATSFRVRQSASEGLSRLGRLGEPALRRVLATTKDAEVRARAQALIDKLAGG